MTGTLHGVGEDALAAYMVADRIGGLLDATTMTGDEDLVSQRWLREQPAKRAIFDAVYGDLLHASDRHRVLDVGAGATALTRMLCASHDYGLIDPFVHDDAERIAGFLGSLGSRIHVGDDWQSFAGEKTCDIVVANDLFPNVDQRLATFVRSFLPHCREMRLSLTTYPEGRWYKVRRVDAEEVMYLAPWDGAALRSQLSRLGGFDSSELDQIDGWSQSLFPNGRIVHVARIAGGLT